MSMGQTETEIADAQAGFRQVRETVNQIMNLRILTHKAREHQQPLHMCFVDFKKAFDLISHDLGDYGGHGISSALDSLAGQTVQETAR